MNAGDLACGNGDYHGGGERHHRNPGLDNGDPSVDTIDAELEGVEDGIREMDEEAEKLKQMHREVEKYMSLSSHAGPLSLSLKEKMEIDSRSIYVGNVDYGATAEELEQHFVGCGFVNRVTILCNKYTGHPKGFAYIEFADKDSVLTSLDLDASLFRGRQIKVWPKRTNRPGISTTNRPTRGRYRRSGRFYGAYRARRPLRGRRGSYLTYHWFKG